VTDAGSSRSGIVTILAVVTILAAAAPAWAAPPPDRPLNLRTSDLYVSALGIADGTTAASSGDGDGFAECGETIEITLTFRSVSKTIVGASVEIDPRGAAVTLVGSATAPLPSMTPGSTANPGSTFVVAIAPTVTEYEWLTLVVWVIPPAGEVFESHRHVPVGCGIAGGSTTVSPPIVFPVLPNYTYSNAGWLLTARDLIHEGVDTYAAKGTYVVAAANGVVVSVNWGNDPAHRGPVICCALAVRHDSGWESWYSHLNNDTPGTDDGQGWGIAAGIEPGTRVVAGQLLGWVGDSGNAETTSPHLHYELHDPHGIPNNPYSYMQSAVSPLAVPCTTAKMACRIAGSDRFDTSARISAGTFPSGADTVVVATGRNYPDALAGAALAARLGAPVLLVDTDAVPASVLTELTRLRPTTIVMLGGTAAITASVEETLSGYGAVVRLAGAERHATAAEISRYGFPNGADTVFVATGNDFVDALGGAPAAARSGAPILLVAPDSVPAATAEEIGRLGAETIVLLGGTAAVSVAVEEELGTLGTVIRLAGADRYATAAAISAYGFPDGAPGVYVAVGTAYPDALAGAAAAAHRSMPLLVAAATWVPVAVNDEIIRLGPSEITILGGVSALSLTVQGRLSNLL
jgi:putative cell wall-binding protein